MGIPIDMLPGGRPGVGANRRGPIPRQARARREPALAANRRLLAQVGDSRPRSLARRLAALTAGGLGLVAALPLPGADGALADPAPPAPLAAAVRQPAPVDPPGGPRPGPRVHTVAPGETLHGLAARYGVPPAAILAANRLPDPDLLRVGQAVVISPAEPVRHTVQPGETVRQLAERYGVEVAAVAAANHLSNPDLVAAGTELLIGGPAAPAPAEAGPPRHADSLPRTYVVQPGDTLRGIAARLGLDVPALLARNDLQNPDLIRPGTELRLRPAQPTEHTVQPGDTLAAIARSYQVSPRRLAEANRLPDPDVIPLGAKLLVPTESDEAPAPPPRQAGPPAAPPALQVAAAAPAAPAATPGGHTFVASVTAYASGPGGGSIGNRTASGTRPHWGTVAADTRRFPFGTRLRIDGFDGTVFVVEDTGSAVRGDAVDVWHPDVASARRFGRQSRRVTVLSPESGAGARR